jgi:hypothetical protein
MASQTKKSKKEKQRRQEKRRQRKRLIEQEEFNLESDETFAFIAGYTEGGAPFGITHEEMADMKKLEELDFGFQFHHLECDGECENSIVDDESDYEDFEKYYEAKWVKPLDKELALQLLVQQQNTTINWENNDWYDPSFDWDNYIGLKGKEQTREELIFHLNLVDLVKGIRRFKGR